MLSRWLDNNTNIFYFWKGRVAFFAILKAMGVKKGDEVIVPGFTCVVVANAIKYLDATPVYVDIQQETLNPSFEAIKDAITDKTKVIVTQNTFGLSTDTDKIAALARDKGIWSVEDCTHGFGGTFKGKANGTWCDASFFSTQWNKPFSTGIGGFLLVNNLSLIHPVKEVIQDLEKPPAKDVFMLTMLIRFQQLFLTPWTYWTLRRLYRFLSRMNIVVGSSEGKEITGNEMPQNYFRKMSQVQMKVAAKAIKKFDALFSERKADAIIYTRFLEKHNKYHVKQKLHKDHAFLKYPVLVKNRSVFEEKARKAKIELGDWFCSPLHPVKENLCQWDFFDEKTPVASKISKHVVNLPLGSNATEKVISFLIRNIDDLM